MPVLYLNILWIVLLDAEPIYPQITIPESLYNLDSLFDNLRQSFHWQTSDINRVVVALSAGGGPYVAECKIVLVFDDLIGKPDQFASQAINKTEVRWMFARADETRFDVRALAVQ